MIRIGIVHGYVTSPEGHLRKKASYFCRSLVLGCRESMGGTFLKADVEPGEWFLVDNSGDLPDELWVSLRFIMCWLSEDFIVYQHLLDFEPGFCSFFGHLFRASGAIFKSKFPPFLPAVGIRFHRQIHSSSKDWIPTVVGKAMISTVKSWHQLCTKRNLNAFYPINLCLISKCFSHKIHL